MRQSLDHSIDIPEISPRYQPSPPRMTQMTKSRCGRIKFPILVTAPGPGPGGQRTFAQNVLQFTPCDVYLWLESRVEITSATKTDDESTRSAEAE